MKIGNIDITEEKITNFVLNLDKIHMLHNMFYNFVENNICLIDKPILIEHGYEYERRLEVREVIG